MSRKQKDAAVAQSVVRRIGSAEVTGPIPVSSSLQKNGIQDYLSSVFSFLRIRGHGPLLPAYDKVKKHEVSYG